MLTYPCTAPPPLLISLLVDLSLHRPTTPSDLPAGWPIPAQSHHPTYLPAGWPIPAPSHHTYWSPCWLTYPCTVPPPLLISLLVDLSLHRTTTPTDLPAGWPIPAPSHHPYWSSFWLTYPCTVPPPLLISLLADLSLHRPTTPTDLPAGWRIPAPSHHPTELPAGWRIPAPSHHPYWAPCWLTYPCTVPPPLLIFLLVIQPLRTWLRGLSCYNSICLQLCRREGNMVKRRSQESILFVNTYFNLKNTEFTAYHGLMLARRFTKCRI